MAGQSLPSPTSRSSSGPSGNTDRVSGALYVDPDLIDGVVFDLDGVLTDTASVHAAAWEETLGPFLDAHAQSAGQPLRPFDRSVDYPQHLDGRLRHEGVAAVLASRSITLPLGEDTDPPGDASIWALANRKQAAFVRALETRGVEALPGALDLLRRLRRSGLRAGLVSASRNAEAVLMAAGLGRFDVLIDGVEASRLHLPGKPDPASFLEAATRLKAPPHRLAVFEDAVAGAQAARAGGFGVVVGIGDGRHAEALRNAGADTTIRNLAEVTVIDRFACCTASDPGTADWVLTFDGLDARDEARREALCTVGNGYMGTRGAAPEASADGTHYPGTYLAGVYNRLVSHVQGRDVEHEDLVNVPNWLPLTFRIETGPWFGGPGWSILEQLWELDVRHGILVRRVRARDDRGRIVTLEQRRLASIDEPHLAALQTRISAENWSGRLEIRSGLDGDVKNTGAREYLLLADRHLHGVEVDTDGDETVSLSARTRQSQIRIALAARTQVVAPAGVAVQRSLAKGPAAIAQHLATDIADSGQVVVDKVVALFTSRDHAIADCGLAARIAVRQAGDFAQIAEAHRAEWERLWDLSAMWLDIGGRTPSVVNLHAFHLLQAVSPRHATEVDAGVTARGLTGEAYRGHVFWDELFIFPYINCRFPELARELLLYRYRRLETARRLAQEKGQRGALFPWQSGSDGREETPTQLFNVRSERWMQDNSRLQRHVGLAIAYNVWDYFQVTGDSGFLRHYGAELLIEIARFWSSLATHDPARDRYDIAGVMGPDEFHDGSPDHPGSGLVNNTYTNVMAAWTFARTLEAVKILDEVHGGDLRDRLDLRPEELAHWDEISRKLTIEFDAEGQLAQFRGYEDLIEFDWDRYRTTYGNIGRLDLILEAEGDSTNRYKLSKQADLLMLFYLFSADELTEILQRLDYRFDPETIPGTVRYHLARTSHGSTLSRVAHAWVLARTDRERSWRLFLEALAADIDDTQQGTTGEGIHLGAMAGTVDLLQRCYTGLEFREHALHLNPRLPDELNRLRFEILFRGHRLELDITHTALTIRSRPGTAAPVEVWVVDDAITVTPGDMHRRGLDTRVRRDTSRTGG